jgi:hypothetical protein
LDCPVGNAFVCWGMDTTGSAAFDDVTGNDATGAVADVGGNDGVELEPGDVADTATAGVVDTPLVGGADIRSMGCDEVVLYDTGQPPEQSIITNYLS